LDKPIDGVTSLWWLYLHQVIPKTLFPLLLLLDQQEQQHSTTFRQQQQQDSSTSTTMDDTSNNNNTTTVRPIFLQGTGVLRYSLFGPVIVVDDVIAVTPFDNPLFQVGSRLTAT
jgi:hypothetical protein